MNTASKKKLVISYDVLEKCGLERGEPLEIRAMTNIELDTRLLSSSQGCTLWR